MSMAENYATETSRRELASGILKQAEEDLRRFHAATSAVERELYQDAYRWVISDDCSWPFSFLNVCRLLNVAPEILRQDLLSDVSLGLFGYLRRHCARVARSLPILGSRVFAKKRRSVEADPVPLTYTV
jgi:hypothetical protein